MLLETRVCRVLGDPIQEDKEGAVVTTRATSQEEIERGNPPHDHRQHFDDLSEEALVRYLLSLLKFLLDVLPNPDFFPDGVASNVVQVLVRPLLAREEGFNELVDESVGEVLLELFTVVGALEGDGHEGELEHCVLGLVLTARSLNLSQSRVQNLDFSRCGCSVWNFIGA